MALLKTSKNLNFSKKLSKLHVFILLLIKSPIFRQAHINSAPGYAEAQLALEWLVHGRMAPSRYPRTATCGTLEGLRMCIQHHPTIQQLASQNHRKLKFQTATFPVVAKWAFLPASKSCTQLMLDVSGSLSYSSLLHRTNKLTIVTIVTIVHIFRFTKEVWLQISCLWPPTLWLALLRVPWKKRPEPCCQKCHGSCLWHPLTEML